MFVNIFPEFGCSFFIHSSFFFLSIYYLIRNNFVNNARERTCAISETLSNILQLPSQSILYRCIIDISCFIFILIFFFFNLPLALPIILTIRKLVFIDAYINKDRHVLLFIFLLSFTFCRLSSFLKCYAFFYHLVLLLWKSYSCPWLSILSGNPFVCQLRIPFTVGNKIGPYKLFFFLRTRASSLSFSSILFTFLLVHSFWLFFNSFSRVPGSIPNILLSLGNN